MLLASAFALPTPATKRDAQGEPLPEGALARLATVRVRGEFARFARIVEVLERLDTPQARALLQSLAGGEANVALTRAAATALQRRNAR